MSVPSVLSNESVAANGPTPQNYRLYHPYSAPDSSATVKKDAGVVNTPLRRLLHLIYRSEARLGIVRHLGRDKAMRNVTGRLKVNDWALVWVCVLLLSFVLFGCESAGTGGSNGEEEATPGGESDGSDNTDSDGAVSPGDALGLPEGSISGWNLGTRDDVVVILVDGNADHVQGYGPITVQDDGVFPGMTIAPPSSEVLLTWEVFREVYEYSLSTVPVDITDGSVRFQSFCGVEVLYESAEILRETEDGAVKVSWIYADGPTRISGTFDTGDYAVTIDLQLTAGWNSVAFQEDNEVFTVTLKTEPEPAGTGWILSLNY